MSNHTKKPKLSPIEQITTACIKRGLRLEVSHFHPAFTRQGIRLLPIHKKQAQAASIELTVKEEDGESSPEVIHVPLPGTDATGSVEIFPISGEFRFTLPWESGLYEQNKDHRSRICVFHDGICREVGKTIVELKDHTGNVVSTGRACTRHDDIFVGSRGITEAYTKANNKLLEALKADGRKLSELEAEAKERLVAEEKELGSLIKPDTDEATLMEINKKLQYVARRLKLFA